MSRRITAALSTAALTLVLATGGASGGPSSPGQRPPKNLTQPSVSGTARVPNTLSSNTGTWEGKGLKFAYQWLRCDSTGASCAAISSATASTKTLTAADVNYTLRVIVTATNRNGSAAATSAQTVVVAPAATSPPPPPPPPPSPLPDVAPSNDTLPSVSGTAQQSETLTASAGSWGGTTPMVYEYQWQRCDSSGDSCAPISGRTTSSYVLASADVGSTMRISVTASNSAGSTSASSNASGIVTAAPAPASVDAGWYDSTSAWNTPIPANPPIHPNNANFITDLIAQAGGGSIPFALTMSSTPAIVSVPSDQPMVTVQVNFDGSKYTCGASFVQAPLPSNFVVENNYESHAAVMVANGDEWDFYRLYAPGHQFLQGGNTPLCSPNQYWQAAIVKRHQNAVGAGGWLQKGYGEFSPRATRTYEGSGTVRPRDLSSPIGSTWSHAIGFAYVRVSGGSPYPRYVPPATGGDGTITGGVPEGARFQLDPAVNCNTWPSLANGPEWKRQLCRTLQVYGGIVTDHGNGINTQYRKTATSSDIFTGVNGFSWASNGLPNDLLSHFRVIDWSHWTGA